MWQNVGLFSNGLTHRILNNFFIFPEIFIYDYPYIMNVKIKRTGNFDFTAFLFTSIYST